MTKSIEVSEGLGSRAGRLPAALALVVGAWAMTAWFACATSSAPPDRGALAHSASTSSSMRGSTASSENPRAAAQSSALASVSPSASSVQSASASSAPVSDFAVVDCKTIKGPGAPGRTSLCELAMKMDPAPLIDAKGFAYVSQFEKPGDDGPDDGHLATRLCGAKAEERVKQLFGEIRFQLSQEASSGRSRVVCSGMQCDLLGEGEWSTNSTLYFRRVGGDLKLEAWTEIEVSLVDPKVVTQRRAFLQKWKSALTHAPCSP